MEEKITGVHHSLGLIGMSLKIFLLCFQGIDSDIEEVTRPTDNLDDMLAESMADNARLTAELVPVIGDFPPIPEEASDDLRLEEEADALAAAANEGKPDKDKLSTE